MSQLPYNQYAQAPFAMSGGMPAQRPRMGQRPMGQPPGMGALAQNAMQPSMAGQAGNPVQQQQQGQAQGQSQNPYQMGYAPQTGGQPQQSPGMGQQIPGMGALAQNSQQPQQQPQAQGQQTGMGALAANSQQSGANPTDSQQSQVQDYLANTYNGVYSPGSGANNFGLGTKPGTLGPTGNMNGSQYAAWQGSHPQPGANGPVGIGMFGNAAGPGQNGAMLNSLGANAMQNSGGGQADPSLGQSQIDAMRAGGGGQPNIFARQLGGQAPQGGQQAGLQQRNFSV